MTEELLQARIDLRVCELRVLAARTALEYWQRECARPIVVKFPSLITMKRSGSNGRGPKD